MELELKAANAKNTELERILAQEKHERLALISRLKENAEIISKQHEEISALKENDEILNFDMTRLETENDHLIRKQREDMAATERLQQELDDALER